MTTTEKRVRAAGIAVKLRAKADRLRKAGMEPGAAVFDAKADKAEQRYRQLRAKESAELHSAAR